jgi:uncharacterized coiled-coil protein SlyX
MKFWRRSGTSAELEKKVQALHAEKIQIEATLRGRIYELENKSPERELCYECKALHIRVNEERFRKESANRYIEELEETILKQESERLCVEAYYKEIVKELCGKLREKKQEHEQDAACMDYIWSKYKKLRYPESEKVEEECVAPSATRPRKLWKRLVPL